MRLRRTLLRLSLVAAVLAPALSGAPAAAAPERARPKWVQRIDALVGDLPVGVVIGYQDRQLYAHRDWVARPPASNEKLLLSMALLSRIPADTTIPTRALATAKPVDGVVHGDVWIVGHGDPETDAKDMADLAAALAADGVRKVKGHVMGATGPFARDWFAPGWKSYFPTYYVALPTALTFHGNVDGSGRHVKDPERRAAAMLTKQLKRAGVKVTKEPGMGSAPRRLIGLATVRSDPLRAIMHRMDLWSRNFSAEVLAKYLGTRTRGSPGTIAKGAAAIRAFAKAHGVALTANDGSGLSYANRVTPKGIVRLLWAADRAPWGDTLRAMLAHGGEGTLEGRLADVPLRAKTGTLTDISALSGWVWLDRVNDWAEFSILSSGITKAQSVHIENAIVRVVNANAAPA